MVIAGYVALVFVAALAIDELVMLLVDLWRRR